LRLSLIRTPNRLDPTSDIRAHFIRAALVPHKGPYGPALVKRGYEFNQAFVPATVASSASGKLPASKSFVNVSGDSVVPTILKRAEDDASGVLVRFYETVGSPAKADVSAGVPVSATQWVNFVEDPLASPASGATATADLHKFEIRNVILHTR
jgi:alpha-mannosidase